MADVKRNGIMLDTHEVSEVTEVVERYYENNRHFPIIGWSIKLLPTDRWLYSDETGRYNTPPESFQLAWDWIWKDSLPNIVSPTSVTTSPTGSLSVITVAVTTAVTTADGKVTPTVKAGWRVEVVAGQTDKDGWMYASDFPSSWHSTMKRTHHVRRRCFIRTRILRPAAPVLFSDTTSSTTSPSSTIKPPGGPTNSILPPLQPPVTAIPLASSMSPAVIAMSSLSCYENQRYYPIKGWSNKLLPTDRSSFSDVTGRHHRNKQMIDIWMDTPLTLPSQFDDPISSNTMPASPLDLTSLTEPGQTACMTSPDGSPGKWVWNGDWRTVVAMSHTDSDGWQYAVDFPAADYQRCMTKSSFVRRREWKRNRTWIPLAASPARGYSPSSAAAHEPPHL